MTAPPAGSSNYACHKPAPNSAARAWLARLRRSLPQPARSGLPSRAARWPLWTALAAAAAALLAAPPALAEIQQFCLLKDVKIETLRNAVRIRILTDGLVNIAAEWRDSFLYDRESGEWRAKGLTRMPLLLANVRGGASSVINVDVYPVSHIELAVPPGARESRGLIMTLVLFKPGYIAAVKIDDFVIQEGTVKPQKKGALPVFFVKSTSGQELIITVMSDRPNEPEPRRPQYKPAPEQLDLEIRDGLVHLRCVNVPIHKVFEEIGRLAGIRVFVDGRVDRRCTANLPGLPPADAIRALADAYALGVRRGAGAFYISRGLADDAAAYWTAAVQVVPLRYLDPEDVRLMLPDLVLDYVRPSPRSNAVIVTGPPELAAHIAQQIRALDKPALTCWARAWVLGIAGTRQDIRNLSFEISGGTTSGQWDSSGNLFIGICPTTPRRVFAALNAMENRVRYNVQAVPEIQVLNGHWALLQLGEREYFWRTVAPAWGAMEFILDTVETGVRLGFKPWAASEIVRARVIIEASSLSGRSSLGPLVMRRSLHTTLYLESGEMILAGAASLDRALASRLRPLLPLARGLRADRVEEQVWILLQGGVGQLPANSTPRRAHAQQQEG